MRDSSFTFATATLLALGGATCARWNDDVQKCHGISDPNVAIQYCTRAIQSGELSEEDLAGTYYNRGIAYSGKGDYDRAIQDYDQAIQINPNYAQAFNNRGIAYSSKGDYLGYTVVNSPPEEKLKNRLFDSHSQSMHRGRLPHN